LGLGSGLGHRLGAVNLGEELALVRVRVRARGRVRVRVRVRLRIRVRVRIRVRGLGEELADPLLGHGGVHLHQDLLVGVGGEG